MFLNEKTFPKTNPKKIHIKADEINIFLVDKKWLIRVEKTTKLEIVITPNIFCLIKFIQEHLA